MSGDTSGTALETLKDARTALYAAVLDALAAEKRLDGPRSVRDLMKAEESVDQAARVLADAKRARDDEQQALGRTA